MAPAATATAEHEGALQRAGQPARDVVPRRPPRVAHGPGDGRPGRWSRFRLERRSASKAWPADRPSQALYRQAQLALREVVGGRELQQLLVQREQVADELTGEVRRRSEAFWVRVDTLGIRDVILPGEMKELLNRVTEAKTAAEAALITRREETAAMRSQLNTARLLESSPTLMRLKELEVVEKVAGTGQLTVVLG